MGYNELYAKAPLQTGFLTLIVAGLAAPLVGALLGHTRTLTDAIFHNAKDSYHPQDKIHKFAVTLYSVSDVILAGFLTSQLRSSSGSASPTSNNDTNFHAAWVALATHQAAYLTAASSSFGWQKTMLPSLGITSLATYFAIQTSKRN